MTPTRSPALVLLFTTLLAVCPAGEEAAWVTDLAKAKAIAAKEGKDLLIDFTGSDWCGWCVRLKQEVFATPAFAAEAPKRYVLVELDFPRQTPQDDAVRAANEEHRAAYEIEGFPTILLTDAQGRPYARTGYQAGGPDSYLTHLSELQQGKAKRDTALAAAAKASGADRARQLDAALTALGDIPLGSYAAEIDQIIALDSDGKAGLRAKHENRRRLATIKAKLETDPKAALADIDQLLASKDLPAGDRQQMTFYKAAITFQAGDADKALPLLKEALAADPQSEMATMISGIIAQMSAKPQPAPVPGAAP